MAAGFVSIPCDTCRVRACVAEAVTRREVLFAWAADMSLGCEDYEPDYFHGVEGVLNVAVLAGLMAGGMIGVSVMALCVAARGNEE